MGHRHLGSAGDTQQAHVGLGGLRQNAEGQSVQAASTSEEQMEAERPAECGSLESGGKAFSGEPVSVSS